MTTSVWVMQPSFLVMFNFPLKYTCASWVLNGMGSSLLWPTLNSVINVQHYWHCRGIQNLRIRSVLKRIWKVLQITCLEFYWDFEGLLSAWDLASRSISTHQTYLRQLSFKAYLCYTNQSTHDNNTSNAGAWIKHALTWLLTISRHFHCSMYIFIFMCWWL